jgi:predicted PurR-regulated permease PerM
MADHDPASPPAQPAGAPPPTADGAPAAEDAPAVDDSPPARAAAVEEPPAAETFPETAASAADAGDGRPVEAPAGPRFGIPGRPLDRYSPMLMGFTAALGVFAAWAVYRAVLSVWSIILLMLVAAFLAIGLNPAVTRFQRWGLRRGFAVGVVGLLFVAIAAGMVLALAPPIVQQGTQLTEELPGYIERLKNNPALKDLDSQFGVIDKLKSAATGETATNALGGVLGGVGLVLGTIFNVVTSIILMFYFLAAFDRLRTGTYRLFPASRRDRARLLGDEMLTRVGAYLSGAVVIAAIAGLTSFVFMQVTGIPYSFALALVVALLDLIPQVGATLGAVVVAIVGFSVSVPVGLAAVVFFLAYQQLENWIIYPRVMKRSVNVTDLAAIVSVLLGAALLGIIGALIAIPVCAAVQLLVREVVFPRQDVR